jgi:hypothetical protein
VCWWSCISSNNFRAAPAFASQLILRKLFQDFSVFY